MTDSHLSADREWPHRPDFNQFKRQAKELGRALEGSPMPAFEWPAMVELFGAERTYCHLFFGLGDGSALAYFQFARPEDAELFGPKMPDSPFHHIALNVDKDTQLERFTARQENPLKQWKTSPIDAKATKHWADYSLARNEMFARTHNPVTPWTVVRADDKRTARLSLIKDLLSRLHYDDKDEAMLRTNPKIIFQFQEPYVQNGMIAS